ncbi:chromosome segregation protein SMC [Acidiferrimicrobium sp. IK]|uniref:chromosome segregation protein SMC n=1 Tax=Acidiferrimicrobium sp. IK TaxID=2871700 RepID=UPI0021CB2483|nr:chromosome segregation protein SMC [Acidiferrimicrobium sp. IK]MCU4183778.1 chromosome segregation protein SMC [Acidiferrimicrobium sp. IK]
MFLKSLTLKGFKSFADSTTLEFEPGVTVVVGPNGSGKSNVVDAVAWVLGAQGPRTVRSAKMEDVIFAGTPKRAALGRAEVSLTIDNAAGLLPIEFSEVTITRTLFRTGESEYAINRSPCRLLDIQELLSDTGVGRQQHVIVSQGNLDAILSSRPEDRRVVIEEAAGVLKYRRRKERSERRLESTEASLVRLQDLLREVRRQLRPLEKQADAARRHGDVVEELTALRRYLAGRELAAIEARLAGGLRSRSELGEQEAALRGALARLDADVLQAEAAVNEARRRQETADLGDAVSHAEGLRARARGLTALLEERRRGVARALESAIDQDVVASLEAEAAALVDQMAAAERDAELLVPDEQELLEAEAAVAEEAAEVEARWGAQNRSGPGDPTAEVRAELRALRSAVERARGELRRLDARNDGVDQRAGRLDAEVVRLRQVLDECDDAGPALDAAVAAGAAALAEAEAASTAAEDARRSADGERHRWDARAEALAQALDEARARAGAERLSDVEGVLGTLLDLVEIDDGWEPAFEAAAGEAIAAVVVAGDDAARAALGRLRDLDVSGAVLPVRGSGALAAPAGRGSLSPSGAPLGTDLVRAHVRARLPGVADMLDHLLAGAVAVGGGWEEVVAVAAAHPELTVVSRHGDRGAGGVWRVGAGGAGVTGAALDEARSRAAAAAEHAAASGGEARAARSALDQARSARAEAVRAADANRSRRRAAADALARTEAELADARRDSEATGGHRSEMAARLQREEARIAELDAMLPALEAEAAAEQEAALAERAARSRLAERAAAVAALRRDLEVRAAGLEERRAMTARRMAQVDERLARTTAERAQAALRREQLVAADRATARLAALVAARETELDGVVERLRSARREESDSLRAVTDRLEVLRRERTTAERQLAETRERQNRAEVDEAEARVRLETLTDAVRRELDCEPEATRDAPEPVLPPGTSATSRRSELERELRLMGPINPLALEEHTALQERHTFLEAQLEDVRSARRELAKVIKAVDAEIVEVFRAAYADVADNFEKLFATLFPGGQGRLRLTDPDHLLETGIEVEARPSGKNVRRLSLLSGGERSLTAMAFLFAVFRSRPSPFYLMDEVEAALDDVNLHRFLGLVHEFRDEAQLVIVSHQRRTMEAADCLYGVTMAPGGSSRVVSERVGAPVSPTS